MGQNCNFIVRFVLLAALGAGLSACETEKSRNPLSPSIAGPIEGVTISAPTAVTPNDGLLIRVGDQPIQLTFHRATSNSERPFWYEVLVSSDEGFAEVVHTADRVPANGSPADLYELTAMLDPEQAYYWRVRALDGANTGLFSGAAVFEVFTPLALGEPEPITPTGGSTSAGPAAVLTVTNASVSGPAENVRYEFQVATDGGFGNVVASSMAVAGSTTTSTTVSDLAYETTHSWRSRVIADGREGQVAGAWSEPATFVTGQQPVALGPPTLLSPVGGATAGSNPTTFTVTNGAVTGQVTIFFHVATDPSFTNVVNTFEAGASGSGTTTAVSGVLPPGTLLYWRVFAGNGTTVSDWTGHDSFRTPSTSTPPPPGGGGGGGGFTPGGSPNAPFTTGGGNPPNLSHIVQGIAAANPGALANSCQDHGGSWEFMDRVVEALRAIDGRWAYNCKRGNCGDVSHDVVDYFRGSGTPHGSSDVSIIDVIGGHCGGSPQPSWLDVTSATQAAGTIGRYKYPR